MANDRGSYGAEARGGGLGPIAVVLGIGTVIYGLSPGARYWYRHRRLPLAEDTTRWNR